MTAPVRTRHAPLQAFEIVVPAAREEAATAALAECGTAGIEVRKAPRGRVLLLAYFPRARGLAAGLRAALGAERAAVKRVAVPRVDWVRRFRAGFRPFTAGRFTIVPRWMAAARTGGALRIVVEPGRAFGTGTHASTRLCLRALEELSAERPLGAVADLGTGTGILAIAALRLGARSADAVDIDPEAVASARLHARLNRVAPRILEGDLAAPLRPGAYDTVLANIIAAVHLDHLDAIVGLGNARARYVLAGLLDTDLPHIRRRYRGLGALTVYREDEWVAVVVRRAAAGARHPQ